MSPHLQPPDLLITQSVRVHWAFAVLICSNRQAIRIGSAALWCIAVQSCVYLGGGEMPLAGVSSGLCACRAMALAAPHLSN